MNKHGFPLFPMVMLLMLAGCGEKGGDAAAPTAPKRRFLSVGTAPPGGTFFVIGSAFAQVVNAHKDDLPWEVTAESTSGTQENIRRLERGELDFAMANAAISYFAVRGEEQWEKPFPIRTVMTLAPNVAMFIAPKGSGVETIADLKGKRVVVGPPGAGFEFFIKPILAAHGITYEDFTPLNATQSGAVDLLADGSAAAAFLGGGVPTAAITQACATQDIHFVPFDSQAREKLVADFPFFTNVPLAAGTYDDLQADYAGMNVGAMQLITSAAMDELVVYEFTKRLYTFRAEVVEKHPAGKAINDKNIVRNTGTPFHPGAIRYFKEIGIWPEDAATP